MTLTYILALYGLLVMLIILVQVLAAAGQVGLAPLASNREGMPPLTGLAARMDRVQMNSVVAMALFAPPVLILAQAEAAPAGAVTAAWVFLLARAAYAVVFALGIPWLRTLIWLVGFAMTAWLYLLAL